MSILTQDTAEELLNIGIALSSTLDLDKLLQQILTEARRLTKADAGTLYLADGHIIKAKVAQCDTLEKRLGKEKAESLFETFSIPINNNSISGAAAFNKEVINVANLDAASSEDSHNRQFDIVNNYQTLSTIAVPMLNRQNRVIGVLQLINAWEDNQIVAFDGTRIKLAKALASQAAIAIQNAQLTDNLQKANLDTLQRLGLAAEWRDKETANHITRVAQYSYELAKRVGWDETQLQLILHASPMHDVGKLGIPDSILHKPGQLTDEERDIMQTHCVIGANILKHPSNPVMAMAREIALGHHEKWNGSGYPNKLSGEAIPISARIVALADVFDALSSRRCYKPPFAEDKVIGILQEENGKHFDPHLVKILLDNLDPFRQIRDTFEDSEETFAKFQDYHAIKLESSA